jgi:hypothetical protein
MMADPNRPESDAAEPPDVGLNPSIPDGELTDDDLSNVSGGMTSASDVLKTRHDTAKNSIGNVR